MGLSSRFDVRRLVFVEESGTHIAMDRLRSEAPRGERAYYGGVPKNRGKNLTLIASIPSLSGMGESMCITMCIRGATDARASSRPTYVEHFLAPSRLARGRW